MRVTSASGLKPEVLTRISILLPLALGAALIASDRWFALVDDEYEIINRAVQPVGHTIDLFLRGVGMHEHPPLYDLLLHGWLFLTAGEPNLLRLPSVLFYVLGAWIVAKAAGNLGGIQTQSWVLLLVVLWPYGFHFGRLTAWYSWSFLLISLLTWSYFRWVEQPFLTRWIPVVLCSLLLVYSNYFGWALLACLAFDFAIRDWRKCVRLWPQLFGALVFLLVCYVPVVAAFFRELHTGVQTANSLTHNTITGIYNLYCIFVSESVAPWVWSLGIPAGTAIAICLLLTLRYSPPPARRLLLYFGGLFAVMTFLGIVNAKRLILLGPWLILPVGLTLGSARNKLLRRALVLSLALIAGIGWYGIFDRTLYAAPRWLEPWNEVAEQAAQTIRDGGAVIGNNSSFFFYLTYLLPAENGSGGKSFSGFLPASVQRAQVYNPQQWIEAGYPLRPAILFVKGLHYNVSSVPTDESEAWLDGHCRLQSDQRLLHDPGAKLKQRFAPALGQVEWRIEIRTYDCR